MEIAVGNLGSGLLAQQGAVLEVRVGPPSLGSIGYPSGDLEYPASQPAPLSLKAVVDTGSFATVVPTRYVGPNGLNLKSFSAVVTNTASQKGVTAEVFLVSIDIEGRLHIPAYYVLSLETASDKCLIGRDMLQTGWFQYHGQKGKYLLHLGDELARGPTYPFWLE